MPDLGTERPLHGRSGPGADLVGQEAALAGGHAGVGLGRAIMALGGVGQLGCEGGGLGRAGGGHAGEWERGGPGGHLRPLWAKVLIWKV